MISCSHREGPEQGVRMMDKKDEMKEQRPRMTVIVLGGAGEIIG